MQITILDHDTSHAGRRANFRFSAIYSGTDGLEHEHSFNFADFAAHLVAAGEFDGYNDADDDGEMWRHEWPYHGRAFTYTFNEVISEFMRTGDLDRELARFIQAEVISGGAVEDFVMERA